MKDVSFGVRRVMRADAFAERRPIVCLVTDRRRLASTDDTAALESVVDQVRAAARAGVDLVHVRESDLTSARLAALVAACLDAAGATDLRVVVNDRMDVALAVGAHGVHLRSDSLPPERVRAVVPDGFLIGRSVHQEDEARAVASTAAVDYLVFGTVCSTRSKPPGHPVAGLEMLDRVARSVTVPVLGIGGIDGEVLPALAGTAAAGFAAIDYFSVSLDRHGYPGGPLGLAVRHARRCYAAAAPMARTETA